MRVGVITLHCQGSNFTGYYLNFLKNQGIHLIFIYAIIERTIHLQRRVQNYLYVRIMCPLCPTAGHACVYICNKYQSCYDICPSGLYVKQNCFNSMTKNRNFAKTDKKGDLLKHSLELEIQIVFMKCCNRLISSQEQSLKVIMDYQIVHFSHLKGH